MSKIEIKLNETFTRDFEFLSQGNEAYTKSLSRVIDKLVTKGFNSFARIKYVGLCVNGELEFLIADEFKECHARLIFANGQIKAPHYRFITTVRSLQS